MKIRKSRPQDIDRIMEIYDFARKFMVETHIDNLVMQNLVEKLGFIHCGTIYVEQDNYPRLAYEKTSKK